MSPVSVGCVSPPREVQRAAVLDMGCDSGEFGLLARSAVSVNSIATQ